LPHPEISELIRVANLAADAAHGPVLRHFRSSDLRADNKDVGGFDPVTIADRDAETAMRAVLAAERPHDGVFGEEHGRAEGTSGLTWVLDPIDGTRAFISGAPVFGVLVACYDGTNPIIGLIDQPYIGERFFGGPDGATLTRGDDIRSLSTRQNVELSDAIVLSTFPEVGTEAEYQGFRAVSNQARLTRYGLDCYGYALVALGQADLVIEAGLNAYDIQGPMAVVQAAGGVVTNWRGGDAATGGQIIAAGCPALHAKALELLAPYAD
jgi:histidinol phosphatase-like enzyme (inositol monophosphatase family)